MVDVMEKVDTQANKTTKNPEQKEGKVAKTLESQTAKIPSDTYLWASFGSIAASAILKAIGRDKDALFVGQWAPSFMLLGIYNKLVKQMGSEK